MQFPCGNIDDGVEALRGQRDKAKNPVQHLPSILLIPQIQVSDRMGASVPGSLNSPVSSTGQAQSRFTCPE